MLLKPTNNCFSSGPSVKRPGWSVNVLKDTPYGRSHRAKISLDKIQEVLRLTREILKIPDDYYVGIVPGSCTGAIEMAMWNLLGPEPVDAYAWDVFGKLWVDDVMDQLKIPGSRAFIESQGRIPQLKDDEPSHDIIMTWNGTTTGVKVPHLDWIQTNRKGLVLVDGISAFFAMDVDWTKLDAAAFSWQKCLGGEAAHGMLVLSPKAIQRLESYNPQWPMPRLFRLKKDGVFLKSIFEGQTLNTPSMLCIEDALDTLKWCRDIGGLSELISRSQKNLEVTQKWVQETPWVDFLVKDPACRSSTSITLELVDIPLDEQWDIIHKICDLLAQEDVAYDINGHILSHPCLRIWGGPTIESSDIEKLLPWLTWAYEKVTQKT